MQGFIKISKYAGMRNDLAQAGGGNTSVKLDESVMLVKSSGFQLADVDETKGYSKVDYRKIEDYFRQNMTDGTSEVLSEEKGNELLAQAQIEGGRASIETFLHAVTGKYTLHSHPMLVNILTARKGGEEILKRLFPDAVLIPYRKPGAALAETYYRIFQKHIAEGKNCDVIFLKNHGLVVSMEDADKVIEKTEDILHKIAGYLKIDMGAYTEATKLWQSFSGIDGLGDKIIYTSENKFLSWESIGDALLIKKAWEHTFCPDCVVYGSKKMLYLEEGDAKEAVLSHLERYGVPTLICHKKQIYIVAESVRKAQEIENVMSFAAQVQMGNIGSDMDFLSEGQQNELLNWDAEKYRRKM